MKAHLAYFAVFGASIVSAIACGARTGLDVPEVPLPDAGPDVVDASRDAGRDVGVDAPDFPMVSDCQDAGTTYIYVITQENSLWSYYPPSNTFRKVVDFIDCPAPPGDTPFSMAVDRAGTAYVVFSPGGDLFRLSTRTGKCEPTAFVPQLSGFTATFGMAFSANADDPGETLYVASDSTSTEPESLATIDTETFELSIVSPFSKVIGNAELTGTGDAQLFGYGVEPPNIHLSQIDKNSAEILSDTFLQLPTGNTLRAWAFGFWGGEFYFFSSADVGSSTVSRYTPGGATSTTPLATLDETIVGAGVSTCAPQQ